MNISKNKEGQIVRTEEVKTYISSEQIIVEISSLKSIIDSFKTKLSELETTLKQVLELEGKK